MKPSAYWNQMLARRGISQKITGREAGKLDGLLADESWPKIVWAIDLYGQDQAFPVVSFFLKWLDENIDDLPCSEVCAGWLSGDPAMIEAATALNNLEAAWFPNKEVEVKKDHLRAKLGVLI